MRDVSRDPRRLILSDTLAGKQGGRCFPPTSGQQTKAEQTGEA